MNKDTLKALQESIAHWEENLKNCPDIRIGSDQCSLCKRFDYNDNDISCTLNGERCPVYECTGAPHCLGTYYCNIDGIYRTGYAGFEELLKKLVQQEVDFLKSLLPEGANDGQNN